MCVYMFIAKDTVSHLVTGAQRELTLQAYLKPFSYFKGAKIKPALQRCLTVGYELLNCWLNVSNLSGETTVTWLNQYSPHSLA